MTLWQLALILGAWWFLIAVCVAVGLGSVCWRKVNR